MKLRIIRDEISRLRSETEGKRLCEGNSCIACKASYSGGHCGVLFNVSENRGEHCQKVYVIT